MQALAMRLYVSTTTTTAPTNPRPKDLASKPALCAHLPALNTRGFASLVSEYLECKRVC